MLAQTYSASCSGFDGALTLVEAATEKSLPQISITGLAGDVVKESRERVRIAIAQLGLDLPTGRVVIHLSPATARKQGSQFDLAIAISILAAEGTRFSREISRIGWLGELSLRGELQAVSHLVGLSQCLIEDPRIDLVLVPKANALEASLLRSPKIRLVGSLADAVEFLRGKDERVGEPETFCIQPTKTPSSFLFDQVIGQSSAKRALQIALAGKHHLLFVGPPGVGKTLLGSCARELLPPLTPPEQIEVAKVSDRVALESLSRPFRAPHHSISSPAFLGGGSGQLYAGEVTRSHRGVLFMDEFAEFRRDVIEGLREPLEGGHIHLHRVGSALRVSAGFTLIATMNPCPCGNSIGENLGCRCSREAIHNYRRRVSGPILDRIDLMVHVSRPESEPSVIDGPKAFRSIAQARRIQVERYGSHATLNGEMKIESHPAFALGSDEENWLRSKSLNASFRSVHKMIRIARTIADLTSEQTIRLDHLKEAWSFHCPESSNAFYQS